MKILSIIFGLLCLAAFCIFMYVVQTPNYLWNVKAMTHESASLAALVAAFVFGILAYSNWPDNDE